MRIVLTKGKQKELIKKARNKITWLELSKRVGLNKKYLQNELGNEKRRTISEKVYNKLCKIAKENYDKFITRRLDDNWGRSKGGLRSNGNTKKFGKIKKDKKLAELFGIILGDGHLEVYKKDNARCYALKIAGNLSQDYEYLSEYISKLFISIFKEPGKIREIPKKNEIFLTIHGKNLIKMLNELGLKSGNKKINNQNIPDWIKKNNSFLEACLRGLIDTDGSVHHISRKNRNLRICFTSYIPNLIEDVHKSLNKLNIKTSKIIRKKQIFISGKEQVNKYIKKIGFNNQKHLKRLEKLQMNAPIV